MSHVHVWVERRVVYYGNSRKANARPVFVRSCECGAEQLRNRPDADVEWHTVKDGTPDDGD